MNDLISVTSSFETLSEDIFSIKPKDLDKINGDLNEENHQLLSALQSNKESFQIELEHLTKEIDKLKSKYEESVQNLNNISGKSVEQEQENGELKSINEKLVQN
jgi:chromosome segregation ATPase